MYLLANDIESVASIMKNRQRMWKPNSYVKKSQVYFFWHIYFVNDKIKEWVYGSQHGCLFLDFSEISEKTSEK